jgi:hypothetical protein
VLAQPQEALKAFRAAYYLDPQSPGTVSDFLEVSRQLGTAAAAPAPTPAPAPGAVPAPSAAPSATPAPVTPPPVATPGGVGSSPLGFPTPAPFP